MTTCSSLRPQYIAGGPPTFFWWNFFTSFRVYLSVVRSDIMSAKIYLSRYYVLIYQLLLTIEEFLLIYRLLTLKETHTAGGTHPTPSSSSRRAMVRKFPRAHSRVRPLKLPTFLKMPFVWGPRVLRKHKVGQILRAATTPATPA